MHKILLVDDDRELTSLLKELLEMEVSMLWSPMMANKR